jgi:hypothetical protein
MLNVVRANWQYALLKFANQTALLSVGIVSNFLSIRIFAKRIQCVHCVQAVCNQFFVTTKKRRTRRDVHADFIAKQTHEIEIRSDFSFMNLRVNAANKKPTSRRSGIVHTGIEVFRKTFR